MGSAWSLNWRLAAVPRNFQLGLEPIRVHFDVTRHLQQHLRHRRIVRQVGNPTELSCPRAHAIDWRLLHKSKIRRDGIGFRRTSPYRVRISAERLPRMSAGRRRIV